MSVRRDPRTDRWYFRARVTFPDGRRQRIFGTPGVPGAFHDMPNTKVGAQEAEKRAIGRAVTGHAIRVKAVQEVPTIRAYVDPFMNGYSAADKPSSRRDKRQRLDAYLLPAVGDRRLDELRQEHIDTIVAEMLDDDASRKQINNVLGVLSALVGYAVTNRVIAEPDLKFFIKHQSTPIDAVAPTDVGKLADATRDKRYRAAIFLAADAGLRIGEIRALPWLEINEIQREVTVAWSYDRANALTEPKSWERRAVPINDRLWVALGEVPRVGPLVFSRLDGVALGYDASAQVIRELYEASGVPRPKMPWHSLRHTFGTELAASGADIETIREMMGHKSIDTTQRYLHTTRERKREAVARLVPSGSHRAAGAKTKRKQK